MKEKIFELIDKEVENRFGPDMHREEDFGELFNDGINDEIFFLMQDRLEATLGLNHEKIFDEIIAPAIEVMYRGERLEEYLSILIANYEDEQAVIETHKSLMPGLV